MEHEQALLKGVSRSFYLSLRLLPRQMRGAASVGYLLARTSDTLADSSSLPAELRLQTLADFSAAVAGRHDPPRWPASLANSIVDPREKVLLDSARQVFEMLHRLPAAETELVRRVVTTIVSGQVLDVGWFSSGTSDLPAVLGNDSDLEDYTWRVAGCVGEFWTQLGFLTLGEAFSRVAPGELVALGIQYGKGLQLVNILRDVAPDLAAGRCYFPGIDPRDTSALLACHRRWRLQAQEWVRAGEIYSGYLSRRRIRVASVLPALLAKATLAPMAEADWSPLGRSVKIPRRAVYQALAAAIFTAPGTARS